MKKVAFISLMAVAVMGLMTTRAWSETILNVNIANSAETPVMLSLANYSDAQAGFPDGSESCILQPGQSTVVVGYLQDFTSTIQWNIIYNFYDGTDTMNQRISADFFSWTTLSSNNCASASQSGMFSVSAGIFIDDTFSESWDPGDQMASWMGLSGTGEEVVAALINFGFVLAGGFAPVQSETENAYYSITIGQKDYNLDKLAGVDWSSVTAPNTPPAVTLVKGQQVYQYFPANNTWLSSQNLNYQATIADFAGANVSIGEQNAYIANYGIVGGTPQILNYINFPGYYQSVVQVSRNPNGPQCVVAFGDSSVWYSDGTNVSMLMGSNSTAILQLCVNWGGWNGAAYPQTVIGTANGEVWAYQGGSWTDLSLQEGWDTSIMQLSAYWGRQSGNLQLVAGLGNGDIFWFNGSSSWTALYSPSGYAPVYQLSATFTDSALESPWVLAAIFDGSIVLCGGESPTLIRQADDNYCIIDVAPDLTFPTFLAGFSDGSVQLYDGVKWWSMQPATGSRVQFLSADWDNFYIGTAGFPCVPYVYSINFQFYYGENYSPNTEASFVYPAIPDVNSTCGDIDGDGQDDVISADGSKWNIWFSSKNYQERSGPYDLGKTGKPAIGDMDGDGEDDFIMVAGSKWYVWLSSLRHNWYSACIPWDCGIHGKPMAGDIDGDGRDDAIMVMGSLWYYWPSLSNYNQRLGPYDTGIHGLPAVGDLNGDGLADLITVVGSNWYVCFSSSPGQYGPWYGPFDQGVSGAPATGDLNGDGLVDLIIVVGSNWYVSYSSAPGQYPGPWYGPFAMSVL